MPGRRISVLLADDLLVREGLRTLVGMAQVGLALIMAACTTAPPFGPSPVAGPAVTPEPTAAVRPAPTPQRTPESIVAPARTPVAGPTAAAERTVAGPPAPTPTRRTPAPALACPPPPPTPAAFSLPFVPQWYVFRPLVATVGCEEKFTLTVRPGATTTAVRLNLASGETAELVRGATDAFTVTLKTAQVLHGWTAAKGNHNIVGDLSFTAGTATSPGPFLAIGVRHENVPPVPITRLGPNAQASPRVLNIHETPPVGRVDVVAAALKRLYEFYGDDFDFASVVLTPARTANRSHFMVKNAVQGIGAAIRDDSAKFGSAGRLVGYTVYPISSFFDLGASSFVHESGHQWINYVKQPPLGPNPGGHWPYSTLANGIMGFSIGGGEGGRFPFNVEPLGGDRYRLVEDASAPTFRDLDLYLMGLLPPEKVKPAIVFVEQQPEQMRPGATVTGISVGAKEVIAAHGPRIPDAANSPKHFTVATVLVSFDRLLEPHELAFFDYMASRVELKEPVLVSEGYLVQMQSPWHVATRGLSTMDPVMRPKGR